MRSLVHSVRAQANTRTGQAVRSDDSEETGHCAERLIALGGPAIQNPVIVFPYIEGLHEFVRDRRWAPRFTIR